MTQTAYVGISANAGIHISAIKDLTEEKVKKETEKFISKMSGIELNNFLSENEKNKTENFYIVMWEPPLYKFEFTPYQILCKVQYLKSLAGNALSIAWIKLEIQYLLSYLIKLLKL